MTVPSRPLPLQDMLVHSRRLVAETRKAVATSRASIAASVSRTAASDGLRGACLPAAELHDADAAELMGMVRSALDQAVIDREVSATAAEMHALDGHSPQARMEDTA